MQLTKLYLARRKGKYGATGPSAITRGEVGVLLMTGGHGTRQGSTTDFIREAVANRCGYKR
jgi:hypothetical protein